jgi:hypothetical protein
VPVILVIIKRRFFEIDGDVGQVPTSRDHPLELERLGCDGTTLHARFGGKRPAIVLLHQTGDMWAPLAVELARDHTVVAPDLRGMGFSSKAAPTL